MNRRYPSIMLAALASATMLGACGSSDPKTPVAPQSAVTELTLGATSLGQVVTDANGRTLYMFTKDIPGAMTSACTGEWYVLGATGTPVKRMPGNGSGGFGY